MFEMLWWVSYLCFDEPDIIEYSPQSWASFNILGEFDFSDEKLQAMIGDRRSSPQKQIKVILENWEVRNR